MDQEIIETDAGFANTDALWQRVHHKIDAALEIVTPWINEDSRVGRAIRQQRIDDPIAVQSVLAVALAYCLYDDSNDTCLYDDSNDTFVQWMDVACRCSRWSDDDQPPRPLIELARVVLDCAVLPAVKKA